MNAENHERMSGAVDQEMFETAIRENLSPEGSLPALARLQAPGSHRLATVAMPRPVVGVRALAGPCSLVLTA